MRLALLVAIAACSREAPTGDPRLPGVAVVDDALVERLGAASAKRGAPYHTRHLATDGTPQFTNRLVLETSPYLVQHAHNPVSWYAWGDEPFARARREHKLVLLSIGYSTCHWCHVMEVESFEDEEVARYVNAQYICIKVDREERPDLDALYMAALVAVAGSGGWPMTIIADGDRRPVFGATYLPRPRLLAMLRELRAAAPAQLDDAARQLVAATARDDSTRGGALPGPEAVVAGARGLAAAFDPQEGGFGRNMKFPNAPDLELLLRYHRRTGDPNALAMVTRTLDAIAVGGIHDHLGGGFHRYATDRAWLVPHFEKMIYDNAQLAILYTEAAQVTGRADFGAIAGETLDYMVREMRSPDGAFYAATDADSAAPDGTLVEGYYFTWTADEAGLPLDGALAAGRHVLHGPPLPDDVRARLLAIRARRTPPARDDKILASWNALAISALAKAAFAFDRADYAQAAARAATFVLARLGTSDGGLRRSFAGGEARAAGTLDDYAFVIAALLDLFEATGEPTWRARAVALAVQLERRFADPAGGYFTTDAEGEQLWTRDKPSEDGAEPSGNAVAIGALLRLAELTGDPAYRTRAERALAAFSFARDRAAPALRAALDQALDAPAEIVIVAPHALAEAAPLLAEVRKVYQPGRTLIAMTDAAPVALPLAEGKHALGGVATAFVCEATRCKQPTSDPAVLATELAAARPLLPDRSPIPLAMPAP